MKTSLTKLKSSFLLSLSVLALPVWAKPVAQVTEVTGQVFVVTAEGKTTSLKANDHLEEKSEIMVEEGGSISLNDYYDATYHLIGGTHVKFFDKSIQLKRGKAWIQAHNSRHPLAVTTANGHINFWKSEFITTFDQTTVRTQALVVNGEVEIFNVLNMNSKYVVVAGTFSLIDPEVDDGSPRTPVKVGLSSLNSALAEFKKLPTKMIEPAAIQARSIASVEDEAPAVKRGEIIFMKSARLPASVAGEAHKYFSKKSKSKKALSTDVTHASIKYYGTSWRPLKSVSVIPATVSPVVAPREPASIAPIAGYAPPKNPTQNIIPDNEFGSSLKKHSDEQPKYSKELDTLIQDLKSY